MPTSLGSNTNFRGMRGMARLRQDSGNRSSNACLETKNQANCHPSTDRAPNVFTCTVTLTICRLLVKLGMQESWVAPDGWPPDLRQFSRPTENRLGMQASATRCRGVWHSICHI